MGIYNSGQVRRNKKEIYQIGAHLCTRISHEIDSFPSLSLSLTFFLSYSLYLSHFHLTPPLFYILLKIQTGNVNFIL